MNLPRAFDRMLHASPAALDPGAGEPNRHVRIPYEPALDGMRGLAVMAVVLYHAEIIMGGRQWFGAGFLGVDAFFVLSGFLITALLIVEHQSTDRIALGDFWSRRARRLLPALFLVIGSVAVYAAFMADPAELDRIRGDGIASLFYVANWRFIAENTSYFDQFRLESPFQHLWSLAIEEQWYVIWPVVVLGVLRWRSSARTVMWLSLALAGLSALWMALLYESGQDPSRVYFGTDTRAQSLLIGAALSSALIAGVTVPNVIARHVVPTLAVAVGAVLGLIWLLGTDTQGWYYRGGFLLLALGVCIVIVAAVQPEGNIVRSALSFRPLVGLGIISYGIYLWHWPVFVVLSRANSPFLANWSYGAITTLRLVVTLAVSLASYLLVERPVRRGALSRRVPFAPALLPASAAALLILLVVSTSRPEGPTFSVPPSEAQAQDLPGNLPTRDDLADGIDTDSRPPPDDAATTSATKVLVVGDSVAYSMASGFTPEIQRDDHLLVWNQTVLFCELAAGPRLENGVVVEPSDTCDDWAETWRGDVKEFQPDVAVLQVGAWELFNRKVDGDWLVFGTAEFDEYFLGLLDDAIDSLTSEGATVALLTTPHFERADTMSAREWTQNETWRTGHVNQLFEQAAADHPDAVLVPFGSWLCPDKCLPELAPGVPVREDGVHFTDQGAQVAARWLGPQLRAIALARAPDPGTIPTSAPPTSTPPTSAPPPTELGP